MSKEQAAPRAPFALYALQRRRAAHRASCPPLGCAFTGRLSKDRRGPLAQDVSELEGPVRSSVLRDEERLGSLAVFRAGSGSELGQGGCLMSSTSGNGNGSS